MTGPRSLYDLSLPIEETEEERIARLNSEGSFSLARAGTGWKAPMADVPPLPDDPAMALLERAKQAAPVGAGEVAKGLWSNVVGLQQSLGPGLSELAKGGEEEHFRQVLADYDATDAGERAPSGAPRTANRAYAFGGPEARAALRKQAQDAMEAARRGSIERAAENARLEEEKAVWEPRVPRASDIESWSDAWDYAKGLVGGAAPSMGLGLGAGALAGRGAAALTAWPTATGELMSKGITRGDPGAMSFWATLAGPPAAAAEYLGVPARLFKPGGGNIVGGLFGEGGAETIQAALGMGAKTAAYGDPLFTRENLVGLGDAFVGGAAIGSGVGAVHAAGRAGEGTTLAQARQRATERAKAAGAPTFQGYIEEPLPDLPAPQDKRVSPPLQAPSETMFQRAEADPAPPGLYSEIRRVFEDGPDEAMANVHAQNFAAYMNKPAPGRGIKPLELEQSGILDFLESRKALGEPVAKSEIIDHLDSKAVKLEVLDRSEQNEDTRWHYDASRDPGDQQTTPGGGEAGTYGEFIITAPGLDYKHNHWPEVEGPVAHGRYDHRVDAEGKVHFVLQEGQADIHQEAQARRLREISRLVRDEGMDRAEASKKVPRDFGYDKGPTLNPGWRFQKMEDGGLQVWGPGNQYPYAIAKDEDEAFALAAKYGGVKAKGLPDAPFKDWMPLVLKTALAKAVKQGLSRFAWTTGDAQNQRNQLSTKIRKLNYHISPDGKYEIEAFPLDRDDRTPVTMTVHPAELAEAVGKDIAGRIQAQEGEVVANSRSVDPISMALHNQSVAIREWAGFDQGEWRDLTSAQRRGAAKEWLASDDQYAMDTAASYAENSGATAQRSLTGEGLEMKGDGKRQIYDVMAKNELERLGRRWGVKTKSVMLPSGPIGGRAGEDEDGNPGEGPRYEVKVAGPSYGRAKLDNVPGATYRIFDNDNSKTVELFPTREEAENALRQKYTEHEPYHYIDIPPEMAKSISEEGLPLYQRSGKEAEPGTGKKLAHDLEAVYERSPEYVEKRQKIKDAAMAIIRKVAPGLTLEVADRLIADIDGKREEVMGAYYTPALDGNLIDHMVAISMNSPDWQATLNHEVVHFLKRAGYINDGEWSVLQKKAEGKGLDKVENARMADLRSREELNASEKKELTGLENKANWIQRFDIEKLYPGKQDIWAEEAVAKAKEAFLRGELKPGTFIAKVFDKIAQFFDALGLRLEEFGFTSPGQVFRRVDTGEVGGRAPGRDEAGTMWNKAPPGDTISPQQPAPTEEVLAAALQDRKRDPASVKARLNITVPQGSRVASPDGTYKVGQNGKPWSDLTEEQKAYVSDRYKDLLTRDDLQGAWEDAIAGASAAAKQAVIDSGATWTAFDDARWNRALRLPLRAQLWYELSAETFGEKLKDLTNKERGIFAQLVGATSARSGPKENLFRALTVLSQHLRGVPVTADLTTEGTVTTALRYDPENQASALANKTGNFADTFLLTAGVPVQFPIAVNDVWVARSFGITDKQLGEHQSLHEVFARYMNGVRDIINEKSGLLGIGHNGGPSLTESIGNDFAHQSWHMQARQWVQMRAETAAEESGKTFVQDEAGKAAAEQGSDYAGEWDAVVSRLQAAGLDINDSEITREHLMDPRFAAALRPTLSSYEDAAKATVEFGTLLTQAGRDADAALVEARELGLDKTIEEHTNILTSAMYHSARGTGHPWDKLSRAAGLGDVTRITAPTKEDPYSAAGTFDGVASPNIVIPFRNATPEQIAYVNAMIGKHLKQAAAAAVHLTAADPADAPTEGNHPTRAVFFDIDGPVSPDMLTSFATAIGGGWNVQGIKRANGVVMTAIPPVGPDGAFLPVPDAAWDSAVRELGDRYGVDPTTLYVILRSVWNTHYVQKDVRDDDGKARQIELTKKKRLNENETKELQGLRAQEDNYGNIISRMLKGWTDDAVNEIRSIDAKIPVAVARSFLKERLSTSSLGEAGGDAGVAGRAETIREGLRERLGRLEPSEASTKKEVELRAKAAERIEGLGVQRAAAEAFLAAKETPSSIGRDTKYANARAEAMRARNRFRERQGAHDAAGSALSEIASSVEAALVAALPKWRARAQKEKSRRDNDAVKKQEKP